MQCYTFAILLYIPRNIINLQTGSATIRHSPMGFSFSHCEGKYSVRASKPPSLHKMMQISEIENFPICRNIERLLQIRLLSDYICNITWLKESQQYRLYYPSTFTKYQIRQHALKSVPWDLGNLSCSLLLGSKFYCV